MLRSRSRSLALAVLFVLAGCGAHDAPRAGKERDDFGVPIAPSATLPRRIVSLNPTTTEILFAIGAGARVVGRTEYDLWPDSARLVPALGPGIRPNVEAVIAARPDLVILYASADNRPAADRLRAMGIRTVAFRQDSIGGFRRLTLTLGQLVGDSARARTVVDTVAATLHRVSAATAPLPRPTIFVHTWDNPLLTIGRGSFMSELISIAGGRNLYDDLPAASPQVTLEDVVRRDPDFVLASPEEARRLRTTTRWQAVRAVRTGHVVAYDTNLVARPSVTLGAAAVSLARVLHPGAVGR